MHYQHRFHAGNFADVFKHLLLVGLLQALNRKDKPWFYLESHSGAGLYELREEAPGRTVEWLDGIGRLQELRDPPPPPLLRDYLSLVKAANGEGALARYPGSPWIAAQLARPQDRLALCEKVPAVAEQLRETLLPWPRAAVHGRDGYEADALLPPKEKRGLVLVDPPFEARDEFERIGDLMLRALGRFDSGIYAAWYPIKNRFEANRFRRRIQRESGRPVLDLQLDNGARGEGQLRTCGLLVVNPPYAFLPAAEPALRALAKALGQGPRAGVEIEWLSPDR